MTCLNEMPSNPEANGIQPPELWVLWALHRWLLVKSTLVLSNPKFPLLALNVATGIAAC